VAALSAWGLAGTGDHVTLGAAQGVAQPSWFVPVDSYRTFDSRTESHSKLSPEGVQPLYPGYNINDPYHSYLPIDAVAVSFNVTVTETEGAGFVTLVTFPVSEVATSNVNWTEAGQTVASGGISKVDIGDDGSPELGILVGGTPDARTHVILDITGYFVASSSLP
jgi:hypothetical protein